MGKRGLKNNFYPMYASISVGKDLQQHQKALSQTTIGEKISREAKTLTKILTKAIEHGDVQQLFALEHIAIKRDMECFGATERRTSAMALIVDAAHRFEETATPGGAS